MIDYEKLKLAHDLVEKIDYGINYLCDKSVAGNPIERFQLTHYGKEETFYSIDDLIEKLQELTRIKPKYKVGQEVWRVSNEGIPESFIIKEIDKDDYGNCLFLDEDYWWEEEQLYPSLYNLIDSRINHWKRLNKKYVSETYGSNKAKELIDSLKCDHESDRVIYTSNPPCLKCVKCGKFYK
jgi:hypothetical protein